jgi:CBS domain-containing protein
MITEDSINFLKSTPPFKFLDDSVIKSIAENLSLEFSLRVIKKGGVKVYLSNDDEMVIDFKSEGDSFGYLSLISGDKSRANIRAIEDTLCYAIPKDTILDVINREPLFGEYFMKSFFTNYLDKTYREMESKNMLFREGEKLLYTTPVKNIATRDAVTASSEITIKEAALIMSEQRISSVLLVDNQGIPAGIITDRDLRDKVVADGIEPSRPVTDIMSTDLITVDSGKTCFDALTKMIRHNIHHLIVTDGDRLQSVVTNHDFMLLQGTSPLSLLKNIDRKKSVEELADVIEKINKTIAILHKEGVKAGYMLRIITELHDRFILKAIELIQKNVGESPSPFAFFVYGSEGRKEETFKTVFRCAIVYENLKSYSDIKDMQSFCQKLLIHVQKIFAQCNLPLFSTHPLGEKSTIYGDISEWEDRIICALHNNNHIPESKKLLDLRPVYGDSSIADDLKERLYSRIREDSIYRPLLPETESKKMSPIGFFKKLVVDESGEQMERLDIKSKGILQIVDIVRALAIAHHISEISTTERLRMLLKKGVIRDMVDDIDSAFEFLLTVLLQSQIIKKETDKEIDNMIETMDLSALERKTLKEVFEIINRLHIMAKTFFQEKEMVAR